MSSTSELFGVLLSGGLIFIYGPAASGKTRLAMEMAAALRGAGRPPRIFATEAGSTLAYRAFGEEAEVVMTMDELVRRLAAAAKEMRPAIVDTINSFYRGRESYAARSMIALAAALLKKSGGVAVGQASEMGAELSSPGLNIISRYADAVIVTRRVSHRAFAVEMVKPYRKIFMFEIREGGLTWL